MYYVKQLQHTGDQAMEYHPSVGEVVLIDPGHNKLRFRARITSIDEDEPLVGVERFDGAPLERTIYHDSQIVETEDPAKKDAFAAYQAGLEADVLADLEAAEVETSPFKGEFLGEAVDDMSEPIFEDFDD